MLMYSQFSRKNIISALSLGMPEKFFIKLFFLYTVAHIGLLFVANAIYWDDLTLYQQPPDVIFSTFDEAGSMFNVTAYLHIAMLSVGPWLYRALTFILGLYTAILFWHILAKHEWIGRARLDLAVTFFAVSPLFAAKVALINFPYTLCLFLFLLAWFLLEKNRVLALIFFFLSFNTHSLLVFFALPMLDLFVRGKAFLHLRFALAWSARWLPFLCLPFVYWVIKTTYFAPRGFYAGYNENFALSHLRSAPAGMFAELLTLEVNGPLLLLTFCALAFFYHHQDLEKKFRFRILLVGLVAFLFAGFPYWILNYVPTFYEWTSRHQLLLPVGLSFIALWLANILPTGYQGAVVKLLVAFCLALNVEVYFEFVADWKKQETIVSQLKGLPEVRNSSLVVFDDRTGNARRRTYRFYEWNALLKQAYSDDSRFGINMYQLNAYKRGVYDKFFNSMYLADTHVRKESSRAVVVEITGSRSGGLLDIGGDLYSMKVRPLVP
jgi:hypothetical protein